LPEDWVGVESVAGVDARVRAAASAAASNIAGSRSRSPSPFAVGARVGRLKGGWGATV
jgi:hypothetical protein